MNDQHTNTIPTRYAGYHFRSRLEARWAVFFDTLDIDWDYEPQGFELGWRLKLDGPTFNYLPDFYLHASDCYVEVKGQWNEAECDKFLNAAASLSGHCGGPNVLLLSSIPERSQMFGPPLLHMHKGDLMAGPWNPHAWSCGGYGNPDFESIGRDVGSDSLYTDCGWSLEGLTYILLRCQSWWSRDIPDLQHALTAARSARFEYGESGPT